MFNILYAGNGGAFDGILISSMSLARATKKPLNIIILTMDFSQENEAFTPITEKQRLFIDSVCKESNPLSKVSVIDVSELYRRNLINSPNAKSKYTPYALLRLLAHMVPSMPDKVLYLDTDTLAVKDIEELYSIQIDDYELAGARDFYGRIFFSHDYINSGVLLLNIKKIKETGLFDRVIARLNEKRLFLPDQSAINELATKKLIIDDKYNEQKHFNRDDTVIQHFAKTILWLPIFHTRNIKPWNTEMVKSTLTHKYDDLLDLYEEKKKQFESEAANEN